MTNDKKDELIYSMSKFFSSAYYITPVSVKKVGKRTFIQFRLNNNLGAEAYIAVGSPSFLYFIVKDLSPIDKDIMLNIPKDYINKIARTSRFPLKDIYNKGEEGNPLKEPVIVAFLEQDVGLLFERFWGYLYQLIERIKKALVGNISENLISSVIISEEISNKGDTR